MQHKKRMKGTFAVLLGVLALSAPASRAWAATDKTPGPNDKPTMEVAFVVDTTGSMGGLLDGAKKKIWTIINEIASAKPTPIVKVGFVPYRDKGDAYVTKVFDLNPDLDADFATLQTFQAEGGGDGPEHVNAGLHDAVHKLSWSKAGSGAPNLYQVIFLVGDFPPHMDYDDGLDYHNDVRDAAERGITVNAMRCGNNPDTQKVWVEIAKLGFGDYFSIAQEGGVVDIPTPYDKELSSLAGDIETTTVAVRGGEARQKASLAYADSLPAASAGARAEMSAKSAQVYGGWDVVTQAMDGTKKVEDIKDEDLPENLRKMTKPQRVQYVNAQIAKRRQVQARITALQIKRAAFIRAELAKTKKSDKNSFDQRMLQTFRSQAGRRGFKY